MNNAEIIGNNAGFVSLPEEYTGNPPVILIPVPPPTPGGGGTVLTTPATPAMQGDAGAATGAGKFFVVSAPGTDSTKTKLTFTYGADFGGTLEYAIVADGAASSTGSWADVPATGVQTGDITAMATGDLYVRIKAVSGTSNASAPVKALEDLTVGLTTPTLNTMEASAAAVNAAGKWFVASEAGTDNTKTKLTFSYNGLTLQYAVVTDGTSVSGASWTDAPSTGVQSGDIAATATGDLYVRIKAEAGVSNASAPVKALEDLTIGLTTPTLNTMEASATAVNAAGKWFVASEAGTDNTKTKLTFSYNGLTLQYAVVTDGTSVSGASWTDVPSTGVQSGDIAATATGDLYVRIKAVSGVSNASAEVKALDLLAVGLTIPGSSSAELIISGSPRTRIGIVDVEADSGSGSGSSITDPVPLTVSLNGSGLNNLSFDPVTDNANIYVCLNDGTQITNQDFLSFYPSNTFNFNALNNYLWVKVVSEDLSTTKYYNIFVQF